MAPSPYPEALAKALRAIRGKAEQFGNGINVKTEKASHSHLRALSRTLDFSRCTYARASTSGPSPTKAQPSAGFVVPGVARSQPGHKPGHTKYSGQTINSIHAAFWQQFNPCRGTTGAWFNSAH